MTSAIEELNPRVDAKFSCLKSFSTTNDPCLDLLMEPLPNLFQNGRQQVNCGKELNPLQLVLHGAKLFSKVVVVEQESFQETNLGLASVQTHFARILE